MRTIIMNEIDKLIYDGIVPDEPEYNPPMYGESYYWDCRLDGLDHDAAVRKTASMMGSVLNSLLHLQLV